MSSKSTTFLAALALAASAAAQERGQYIPGFQGLNSALQPPPGATYANYLIWYPTDTFKDGDGDEVPIGFDLDLVVDFNLFLYTTEATLFGATYGVSLGVPIVNQAVSLPALGAEVGAVGIGDVYIEPINLGWKASKAEVKAAYGFVAPTGRFDEDGDDTTTTDYWGHELTLAVTAHPDEAKMWQVSVSSNIEFHQTKRHEDVKVGNNMTLEYGIGKTFVRGGGHHLFQLGAVGYAEFQLTHDSGDDAVPEELRTKDRVFGLGGEFGIIWPQSKFNLLVRAIPEFGARARTSGFTLVVAGGKGF